MKLQQQRLIHLQQEPITKLKLKIESGDPVQDLRDYFYILLALHKPISFP